MQEAKCDCKSPYGRERRAQQESVVVELEATNNYVEVKILPEKMHCRYDIQFSVYISWNKQQAAVTAA